MRADKAPLGEDNQSVSLGKRTAKSASAILVSRAFTFVAVGLSFIFIVRLLGPSTYGIYTLALAMAGTVGALGDFGLSSMVMKFIPQTISRHNMKEVRSIYVNSLAVLLIETMAFSILSVILGSMIATYMLHDAQYSYVFQIASFNIVLSMLYVFTYSTLIALGRNRQIVSIVVMQSAIQAVLSVIFALLGFGALAPLFGLFIGYAVATVYAHMLIMKGFAGIRPTKGIETKRWKPMLKFSLPISLSVVAGTFATNISLLVLGYFTASFVVGNFGLTFKFANMFDVFLGAIGAALLPAFSIALASKEMRKKITEYYNYSVYFALIFAAPIILYLIILSTPFSYTLFGSVYSLAPYYISAMSVGIILIMITAYTTNLMVSLGMVKSLLKANVMGAIIQIALLPVLIPLFQGLGLAILMFVLVPAIVDMLFLRSINRKFKISLDAKPILKVTLAAIVSSLFILPLVYVFGGANIPLLIAAFVEQLFVYPIMLVLIGGVDKRILETIKGITWSIPILGRIVEYLVFYATLFLRV
ncbi:MAG: oligosaccharide flippase family protein [Candidatus Marsarchaeota archaeon]|nr:oligosaccharide flippase family protein [Candidatus Marsarchaeota archaeon]